MKRPAPRLGHMVQATLVLLMLAMGSSAHGGMPLGSEPVADSRVLRLDHAPRPEARTRLVAAARRVTGEGHVDIYAADRDGAPFRPIGRITDPAFVSGLCCGTLYELPRRVGGLQEGTLLWAASSGQGLADKHMSIRIYRSDNEGRSWSFLGDVRSPKPGQLWEPEFGVGGDGALILFYSDETEGEEHSQFIRKVRTYDGVHWLDPGYVVASETQRDRPGMPVTRRLADGRWMMAYELCGPARCSARYRLSGDGWDWGNPADAGAEIRLSDGAVPAHGPRFTVAPDGTIVLVAQIIETPEGKLDAQNGRVLLVNDAGNPAMPWRTIPAPVPVPGACSETCHEHEWCSNYSPSLLTGRNGAQVLEFTSDWTDRGCLASYAWAPLHPGAVMSQGRR